MRDLIACAFVMLLQPVSVAAQSSFIEETGTLGCREIAQYRADGVCRTRLDGVVFPLRTRSLTQETVVDVPLSDGDFSLLDEVGGHPVAEIVADAAEPEAGYRPVMDVVFAEIDRIGGAIVFRRGQLELPVEHQGTTDVSVANRGRDRRET